MISTKKKKGKSKGEQRKTRKKNKGKKEESDQEESEHEESEHEEAGLINELDEDGNLIQREDEPYEEYMKRHAEYLYQESIKEEKTRGDLISKKAERYAARKQEKDRNWLTRKPDFTGKSRVSHAPLLVDRKTGSMVNLLFRGMSVNNIFNLLTDEEATFTVRSAEKKISPYWHVKENDPQSPYLSFEQYTLDVSAGKFAPKPVDEDRAPLGVTSDENDFLSQDKSYSGLSKASYADKKWLGYVGGVELDHSTADQYGLVDISSQDKATKVFDDAPSEEDKIAAVRMASADREILLKPGKDGISKGEVVFVATVKVVTEAYFEEHFSKMTDIKGLGWYRASVKEGKKADKAIYYKIQIVRGGDRFKFQVPPGQQRVAEDSGDEMSDNETMASPRGWKIKRP